MQERIDQLEKTILDLGTEVYKLKHALVHSAIKQHALLKFLDGLKAMLQDKGYLTAEEIEEAAVMTEMTRQEASSGEEDEVFTSENSEVRPSRKEFGH